MRKKSTLNECYRSQWGRQGRLDRWLTPLGLILLLCVMLMPNKAWAQDWETKTYDFTNQQGATVAVGAADETYTNCNYFTQIGNVADPDRFAAQGAGSWLLRSYGFLNGNTGGRRFLISKLYATDIVTIETGGDDLPLDAGCTIATKDGNTFTMTEKGSLVVSVSKNSTSAIRTITIKHDKSAAYSFSPSIEIYNLNNGSGNLSIYDKATPDFNLNGSSTGYLYSSNYALNNRIAVNSTDGWSWDNGLKNNTGWDIKNLAISNLMEGDRVVITYQDGTNQLGWYGLYFGSTTAQNSTELNSEAFKDINNNGELDESEGEAAIKRDDKVESQAVYTMTHDGHLDLIVFPGAIITKIEIYSDHRALINSTENYKTNQGGYTMYFEGTGEIKEKSYMVPGGLKVQFGNDNEAEVAHVTSTVEGPVAYINDYDGFKMARNSNNNIESRVPTTGTYYRFTPDVDGIIHFTYKAQSVRYLPYEYWNHGIYWNPQDYNVADCEDDAASGQPCPYALFEYTKTGNGDEDYTYTIKWNQGDFANKSGGNNTEALVTVNNDIEVKAGKIYYLYGNWNGDFGQGAYCGVARLMDVTFIPDKFVEPLAKCIDNAKTEDLELATVHGYTTNDISEKRKSASITGYTAQIVGNKLQVSNITYAEGADKAGVILLKLGTGAKDPVFVLTIAYDAAYCSTNWDEETKGYTEGHTWDFSSDPLEIGSYWTDFFDTNNNINSGDLTKNTSSQLYDEIDNRFDPDGAPAPEWDFTYLSKVSAGELDPTFLNIYDMAGDNADMIWETGGLWFETGSNLSCLFNEKQGSIDRTNTEQRDPQRYVGIRKGGEFTIPWLDQDDRVVIYMGNSTTSSAGPVIFEIDNALDALGKEITSEYRLGGSTFNTWQADGSNHGDPNYQGCYHFFAKADGDMTFKMVGGTVCKIYKIVIYRGNHMRTNDITRLNNGPLVLVNEEGDTEGKSAGFNLHYRGKGEVITNPEVLVKTGNLTDDSFSSDYLTLISGTGGVNFTTRVGDFGNFRLRLKDMDYSGQYVCDFADRNLTVGYKQQVEYPYTWDFTDVMGFSSEDMAAENSNYPETEDVHESKGWDLSMWDEDGSMLLCNPDPSTAMDDNYLFYHDSDKGISNHLKGNQLFANDKIIPETKGLWFYFDNNDRAYNKLMTFDEDGMHLTNYGDGTRQAWWNYKMIVPSVPQGAAVYLRASREECVTDDDYTPGNEGNVLFLTSKYAFGSASKVEIGGDANSVMYQVKDVNPNASEEEGEDYIMAIYNAGEQANLTLTLNGWCVKKMSVSEDDKKVNKYGWTTESRARIIDPELTAFLTGYDFESCPVQSVDYENFKVNLNPFAATELVNVAEDGDHNAYIIHNKAEGIVNILNDGFHLFVPDMNDYTANREDGRTNQKAPKDLSSYLLVSQVSSTNGAKTIKATQKIDGVDYNNYALTYKYYDVDKDGNIIGDKKEGKEAFYRINKDGASSIGNQAYLPLVHDNITDDDGNYLSNVFYLDYVDFSDPDGIETMESKVNLNGNAVFYNLNGQKLNGVPTKSGLYIVNGKKIVIR